MSSIRQFSSKSLPFGISFLIVLLDQVSKLWVQSHLVYGEFYKVLPYLNLHFVYNKGIAFSMFANSGDAVRQVILVLNILISVALMVIVYKTDSDKKMLLAGLSLILGGALGNIIDKMYLGMVIDFIDVYFQSWHFATFNIADSAISCGAVLVCVEHILKRHG